MAQAYLNVTQAARECNVSRNTVYRRKEQLMEHGAQQTEHGLRIPYNALIAVGLAPRTSPPDTAVERSETEHGTPHGTPQSVAQRSDVTALEQRVKELEEELRTAQEDYRRVDSARAVAEARAEERNRVIESQERAIRLITSRREELSGEALTEQSGSPQEQTEPAASAPQEGGLFGRLFRR